MIPPKHVLLQVELVIMRCLINNVMVIIQKGVIRRVVVIVLGVIRGDRVLVEPGLLRVLRENIGMDPIVGIARVVLIVRVSRMFQKQACPMGMV